MYEIVHAPILWNKNDKGCDFGDVVTINDPLSRGDDIIVIGLNGVRAFMKVDGDMEASNETFTAKLGIDRGHFICEKIARKEQLVLNEE